MSLTSSRITSLTLPPMGFPGSASGKEPACKCRRQKRHGFEPWVRKSPWRRAWQPTPVFLPWESHGQRSLVGFGAWGCKVLDTTGVTWHAHTHPYIYILYFSRQSNLLFSMVTLGMSPLWECPTSRCLSPLPQNPTSLSRQDQSSSGHLCWLLSDHLGAHLLLQVSSTKHFA